MTTNLYLIWSVEHQAWWRPFEFGYTGVLYEAGLYGKEAAEEIVRHSNVVAFNECAIPLAYVSGALPKEDTP